MGLPSGFLGIDACKGGWVGVVITKDAYLSTAKATTAAEVIALAQGRATVRVVGIDIPIGLPSTALRPADLAAREVLKSRSSTIFLTPTAEALELRNPEASEVNRAALKDSHPDLKLGVSSQALALGPRIREITALINDLPTPATPAIIEVHPEVSFAHMRSNTAPDPVRSSKKTWAGTHERLRLLRGEHIVLPDDLGDVGETTSADDIIDAAAVAWTARRFHNSEAIAYGCGDASKWRISDGDDSTIWA